ncbi:flagellar protein FlgJ [Hypnocyclicus thermotrophus]|uniref:Flagellar protein FlgJ n=1 Tax=Hypnocyclicus thermotrophus TaxID=1627895 RepID=A0AA46I646_9FUSO|nr:rod-binding protein [Hypnocyclicus thermotrophus]TDT71804.1 flagellar protein FlgJ [Hypnocyclicus thermotrophus]
MINTTNYLKYLNTVKIPEKKLTKDEKALKETSEEFEALFVKMLLDSMDKTVDKSNNMFYAGNSEEIFKSMLNTEYSKQMAKSSDFGIAKNIYEQLSKNVNNKK